jgi:hypothetical protein
MECGKLSPLSTGRPAGPPARRRLSARESAAQGASRLPNFNLSQTESQLPAIDTMTSSRLAKIPLLGALVSLFPALPAANFDKAAFTLWLPSERLITAIRQLKQPPPK